MKVKQNEEGCKVNDPMVLSTHRSRLTHICFGKLSHHWFRWWLVVCLVPSHYLNQFRLILNCTLVNKRGEVWMKIQQISFKIIYLKMPPAKCRPFCLGQPLDGHYPYTQAELLRVGAAICYYLAISKLEASVHCRHAPHPDNQSKIIYAT